MEETKQKKEYPVGDIFKLSVGLSGTTYFILGKMNDAVGGTISRIVENTNTMVEDGVKTYLIFAKKENEVEFLANKVENMPVVITYSRPKGEPMIVAEK